MMSAEMIHCYDIHPIELPGMLPYILVWAATRVLVLASSFLSGGDSANIPPGQKESLQEWTKEHAQHYFRVWSAGLLSH